METVQPQPPSTDVETKTAPTLGQVAQSVGAAFFGVQSSRNRKRDFTHGKPAHFIVIGLLMTAGVALALYTAVRIALHLVY